MRYVFALAALAACSGPDDKGGQSGETGTTGPTECPDGLYEGPISIVEYSVTCENDAVVYFVETEGWTGGGRVFSQETSNDDAWADEHVLYSYEFDVCQAWDRLSTSDQEEIGSIATVTDSADVVPNETTLFTCENHITDPAVMSYAAEVYDIDGAVVDCVAWGDDPQGLIDGTAGNGVRANDPSFDVSNCRIGNAAR
jgi:hypothetical protein